MRITPEALEGEFSLTTACSRLVFLSRRDEEAAAGTGAAGDDPDDWSAIRGMTTSLDVPEALELLALGEVIARKAHDSRLTGIRAALRGGAGWDDIAAALGVAPQEAWDRYAQAVDGGRLGPAAAAEARGLGGSRPGPGRRP